jgi:pyruvate dehydrogenase E2 component (dihydrolipoamide acetyltransferase)
LKPDEYMGGSCTVSNLGMFGLDNFQPIINPPQVAILAVAAIKQQPCVDDEGHLYVGWQMGVTLACDHRVLDGAIGAKFLRDLRQILDHPEGWAR